MDQTTSRTLLERARNNEEDAWRRLIDLYGPLVARWCAHGGLQGPDAEDVQQQVFQAVFRGLEDFRRDRPGDTFRGWLRIITRNKLLDYFRRQENQPRAPGGTDAQRRLHQLADHDLPEDDDMDLGGLYHRALELVRSEFEHRTWEAFWKVAIDGHTAADVAAELGMTPTAVRKAKSRVLLRLRQEIGDLID
jgi:RNA polymerase sigma-70 factor (ECF subfamily)